MLIVSILILVCLLEIARLESYFVNKRFKLIELLPKRLFRLQVNLQERHLLEQLEYFVKNCLPPLLVLLVLIHCFRDYLFETSLLVDNHAARVQDFLENPNVSIFFEEHSIERLFEEALENRPTILLIKFLNRPYQILMLNRVL